VVFKGTVKNTKKEREETSAKQIARAAEKTGGQTRNQPATKAS